MNADADAVTRQAIVRVWRRKSKSGSACATVTDARLPDANSNIDVALRLFWVISNINMNPL